MRPLNDHRRGETVNMSETSRTKDNELETVGFNKYIRGGTVKIEPEEVSKVKQVNRACTDIELESGETVRVKGSYKKVRGKLGQQVKPEGLDNLDYNWRKDKKLKHFAN